MAEKNDYVKLLGAYYQRDNPLVKQQYEDFTTKTNK